VKNSLYILLMVTFLGCTQQKTVHHYDTAPQSSPSGEAGNEATFQGTINGGGGKGVLCASNPENVEVLDIYEGRELYNLNYSGSIAQSEKEMHAVVLKKFISHFYPQSEQTEENLKIISESIFNPLLKNIKFTAKGQKLKHTVDASEPLISSDCKVVQLAVYYDESVLIIDKEYWDKMDLRNKAALLLHELVYFMVRQQGESNSIQSRKLVGHLLSDSGIRSRFQRLPKEKFATCEISDRQATSKNTKIYLFNEINAEGFEQAVLLFDQIEGKYSLFETFAEINVLKDFDFLNPKESQFNRIQFGTKIDTYANEYNQGTIRLDRGSRHEFSIMFSSKNKDRDEKEYLFTCKDKKGKAPAPQKEPDLDITKEFISVYGGKKFRESEHGEYFEIGKDGQILVARSRQVGHEDDPEVPYPTVCSYAEKGEIKSIKERSKDSTLEYMEYASHKIEIKVTDVSLIDPISWSKNDPSCGKWIERLKSGLSYLNDTYMELVDKKSFRTHTSGGGDYVKGGSRTESTLDELYELTK